MDKERIERIIAGLREMNSDEIRIFSAPGRTELGGNHTDHQNGRVLAAAVDIDAIGAAALNGSRTVRVKSRDYRFIEIDLDDLAPKQEDEGISTGLVRGVLEYLRDLGCPLVGFDLYTETQVPSGSGLSSSAAFEVLIGTAAAGMCGAEVSPLERAKAGKYAENVHFGKPCGLMDQLASATGGVAAIDFGAPEGVRVRKIELDLLALGYALCIVDTGASHNDLTDEYAAVPAEMREVAAALGGELLTDLSEETFWCELPNLRGRVSDRALLRAIHFYSETRRAAEEAEALEQGDFGRFLALMKESGRSSWELLQNVYPKGATEQPAALALALCEKLLGGRGACRVHGGGFAGTIQAIVPLDLLDEFKPGIEALCGPGSCRVLNIREEGGIEIRTAPEK